MKSGVGSGGGNAKIWMLMFPKRRTFPWMHGKVSWEYTLETTILICFFPLLKWHFESWNMKLRSFWDYDPLFNIDLMGVLGLWDFLLNFWRLLHAPQTLILHCQWKKSPLAGLPRKILIARENTCLWKDCLFTKFSLTCSCICFWVRPLYLKNHFCVSGVSGLRIKIRFIFGLLTGDLLTVCF